MIWLFRCLIIFILPLNLSGQVISGTVIDNTSKEPLVYASIGVIATDIGVTTNEQGKFRINVSSIPKDATVRISMIGYQSNTFVVSELTDNIVIGLTEEPTVLKEVLVKPAKTTQLGSNTTTKLNLTGWGGFGVGAGGERGIKIDSKKFPVYLHEVNVSVARNAYDSVLLRLHIRSMNGDLPGDEMLTENIFVIVRSGSQAAHVDVARFGLEFNQPFAVSFEWVKAWGNCSGRSCFLQFSVKRKGTLFAKEASQGLWRKYDNQSPAIFVECSY